MQAIGGKVKLPKVPPPTKILFSEISAYLMVNYITYWWVEEAMGLERVTGMSQEIASFNNIKIMLNNIETGFTVHPKLMAGLTEEAILSNIF